MWQDSPHDCEGGIASLRCDRGRRMEVAERDMDRYRHFKGGRECSLFFFSPSPVTPAPLESCFIIACAPAVLQASSSHSSCLLHSHPCSKHPSFLLCVLPLSSLPAAKTLMFILQLLCERSGPQRNRQGRFNFHFTIESAACWSLLECQAAGWIQ